MSNYVLELDQVSKIYRVGTQTIKALDEASFQVKRGEFIAVMGPSGSGKSTLLQVASMLAVATHGKILINSKDVTSYSEVDRAKLRNKEIGFIFQKYNLLQRTTATENTALPLIYAGVNKDTREQRANKILSQLGMGDRLNNTPAQLSGGQQQRVAIARALINEPSIIFADEPTGNLGSVSGKEVEKALIDLNKKGKTIIMVTHEKEVSQIAKRLISLKDGRIIGDEKI